MFFLRPICFVAGHHTISNEQYKKGNGQKRYICVMCGKHTDSKY